MKEIKSKVNIIQFMPYFPPHRGGVETVGEEIGQNWTKNNLGEFINIVTEIPHPNPLLRSNFEDSRASTPVSVILRGEGIEGVEKIIYENTLIGYKKDGYEVLVVPSIEIINNFPVYKTWSREYKIIKKYLKEKTSPPTPLLRGEESGNWRVITHTRFFLTSFIGGLFARKHKIKWIHIEHGSSYVLLSSKIKTYVSILYDKTIGRWVFKKADKVLAISKVSRKFILNRFIKREVTVFYRGVDLINDIQEKIGDVQIVYVGRLVFLKGVSNLIDAYTSSKINNRLVIIGDGEERSKLEEKSKGKNIEFIGYKDRKFVLDYLSTNNCILVNPSFSEGMPTTVIEGLSTKNVIIATDVGGTKEVSNLDDLILVKAGDEKELKSKLIYAVENYDKLQGLSYEQIKLKFSRENNIFRLYDLVK